MKRKQFFDGIKGQQVAVCGIGHNNLSVIHQLLEKGVAVTACDKRSREQLGDTAAELETAGAVTSILTIWMPR